MNPIIEKNLPAFKSLWSLRKDINEIEEIKYLEHQLALIESKVGKPFMVKKVSDWLNGFYVSHLCVTSDIVTTREIARIERNREKQKEIQKENIRRGAALTVFFHSETDYNPKAPESMVKQYAIFVD